MKIDKILENLNEKFYKGFKHKHEGYTEVFLNPSLKETREVASLSRGFLRFYASSVHEDLYIWNSEVLHHEIENVIGIRVGLMQEWGIQSIAELKDGKVKFAIDWYGDNVNNKVLYNACIDVLDGKYDWLSKYGWDMGYMKETAKKKVRELERFV